MTIPRTPEERCGFLINQLREGFAEHQAIAYASTTLADYRERARVWREKGVSEELVAEFETTVEDLLGKGRDLPALLIAACLDAAVAGSTDPLEEQVPGQELEGGTARWPSSVRVLDQHTDGGFYGVTAIAGPPKAGKSLLALASALEAAESGWFVVYVNAEMTRRTMTNRVLRYLGIIAPDLADRFRVIGANPGVTREMIFERVKLLLPLDAERLLVVLDSANALAELEAMHQEGGYFPALHGLAQACVQARKRSEGLCSFLLVSETNKGGDPKGLKLSYFADLIVVMKLGDAPDLVDIKIAAGRESPSGVELGSFLRNWRQGRFEDQ